MGIINANFGEKLLEELFATGYQLSIDENKLPSLKRCRVNLKS